MDFNVVSIITIQVMVVGGIAAALLMYLMKFRRSRHDIGHKAVFVVGCDDGLGLEAALRFDKLGFRVFAGCVDTAGEGAKCLRSQGSARLHVVAFDVCNEEKVQQAVEYVQHNLPTDEQGLWAFVNTTAECVSGLFEWQTWEQCEYQVQTNLLGSLRVAKAFLHLLRMRKGRFVTVGMLGGQPSYPGFSVYAATKAALEAFAETIQFELEGFGVKAITISPIADYRERTASLTLQEHVDAMWKNMSLENKKAYKNYFRAFCHRVRAPGQPFVATPAELAALDAVLADLEQAVLVKCPRSHYSSAPWQTKLYLQATSLLPIDYKKRRLEKAFRQSFLSEQLV